MKTKPTKEGAVLGITSPDNLTEIELSMSNYFHSIDEGFAEALKAGGVFARHAGWNFNGRVWWSDGQFHEQVWTYHVPREIISADTLKELMKSVNDEYGWE